MGGIIVDSHGYGGTFIMTAFVQTLAWSVYWFMLPLVPLEKKHKTLLEARPGIKHSSNDHSTSLESPLLMNASVVVEPHSGDKNGQ